MKQGIVEQRHGRSCPGTARCGCPWRYRVDGSPGVAGRRHQVTRGGFRTKTEALEALAQWRVAGGEQAGRSLTVRTYLDEWIVAKGQAGRRESTLAQYRLYVEQYLQPVLGHVRLADLTAHHLDRLAWCRR